ncbi:unnamed protein product, partial [Symbiodinium sp. CCMP2592]
MGAGPSCNQGTPHQLDIEAVDAAKPNARVEVLEIHDAMQCSGDTDVGTSDADKGMNDDSRSASDESDSYPRVRVSKILTVTSKELMRGISMKETLQGWGRLWRQSPIDLPEK